MQNDLFEVPLNLVNKPKMPKLAFLDRYRITLRLDQALLGVIAFIVLYVFVFSTGVEKGKTYAVEELKSERSKREAMVEEFGKKLGPAFLASVKPEQAAPQAGTPAPVQPVAAQAPAVSVKAPSEVSAPTTESKPSFPAGKYTIQLVTYKTLPAAQKLISTLNTQGHQGFVIPSGDYLQVCANAFQDQKQAKEGLNLLKTQGFAPKDAYIRAIPH